MTFPEWLRAHARWYHRLACWIWGHDIVNQRPYRWTPYCEADDRRHHESLNFCSRCGFHGAKA